eukprot:357663-Chlamydomonas_euryale.AAC.22
MSLWPVHNAAFEGWVEGSELLLSAGAKVNASNNAGDTPWHWAANMGNEDVMSLLVQVRMRTIIHNVHTTLLATQTPALCGWHTYIQGTRALNNSTGQDCCICAVVTCANAVAGLQHTSKKGIYSDQVLGGRRASTRVETRHTKQDRLREQR